MKTDQQRAALEWLGFLAAQHGIDGENGRILKAMLAEPRLPECPSPQHIDAMLHGGGWTEARINRQMLTATYRALYAHLTAPKTKTIEVWVVMGWHRPTKTAVTKEDYSREWAEERKREWDLLAAYDFVQILGPFPQEMPA